VYPILATHNVARMEHPKILFNIEKNNRRDGFVSDVDT